MFDFKGLLIRSMTSPSDRGIPFFQVSTDDVSAEMAFAAFKQSVQDVFAISRRSDDDYRLDLIAWHLGTIMLGTFRSSALAFDRSPALVASSGLDHFLVQLYVEGGFTGVAGDRPVTVGGGDIVIFDLAQTLQTQANDFSNITLLIPRAFFDPTNGRIDGLHGLVLPAGGAITGMLASYMIALAERTTALGADEADVAAKSTVALITNLLSASNRQNLSTATFTPSPISRLTTEIDRRLRDPDLDADMLAASLGMSRASLYRAFDTMGGIADYIRRRRLTIAAMALTIPENRRRKISEIAFECGFSSESAFNRAFKAAFGMPPSQARAHNNLLWSWANNNVHPNASADFVRWMRMLRA
ncbi:helix-turn-helix domain-containing protein [Sphingomonas bisphenolicum]|nr:helix-turn-helix domain-containing protein [Sphingomonas bisphenolicum]